MIAETLLGPARPVGRGHRLALQHRALPEDDLMVGRTRKWWDPDYMPPVWYGLSLVVGAFLCFLGAYLVLWLSQAIG